MTSRRNRVQQVLDVTSREAAELGRIERREIFIVLRQAEGELSDGLREWLKNAPDGGSRFTAQQMRNALANVRVAMQTIRSMDPLMAGALESIRRDSGKLALSHVESQLLEFSQIFEGTLKPVNIRVAAAFARGEKLLIRKHAKSARRYAGEMEKHIRRQLMKGVLKGESFEQMALRLSRLAPNQLVTLSTDPADQMARGLMQLPRSSASRIIRTEAIEAYNTFHHAGIEDLAEDDDDIRKRWDSTLDRRGCQTCRKLDGQVRKVDEDFEMNGREYKHPTAHPHCRCTVVPWAESWKHDSMQSTGTEAIDAPDPKPFTPRSKERAPAK